MGLLCLTLVELGLYCGNKKCQLKVRDIAVHKTHQLEEHSLLGDYQQTLFSHL
jgi:hypothetical protein